MSKEILLKISGVPVYWINEEYIEYTGEMTCCADGSPRCYGPKSPPALDYLGNAGSPETGWWGVVTDANDNPVVQQKGNVKKHPYPGLYVSCTAYGFYEYDETDCRCWVDAEKVNYSVIPSSVRMAVEPKFLGCRATIFDKKTQKQLDCVCAEIGPSTHMGEASMLACSFFGLSDDPKAGGSSDKKRFIYRFWPGDPAEGWVLI